MTKYYDWPLSKVRNFLKKTILSALVGSLAFEITLNHIWPVVWNVVLGTVLLFLIILMLALIPYELKFRIRHNINKIIKQCDSDCRHNNSCE
mgnify:CR=1 FL=1